MFLLFVVDPLSPLLFASICGSNLLLDQNFMFCTRGIFLESFDLGGLLVQIFFFQLLLFLRPALHLNLEIIRALFGHVLVSLLLRRSWLGWFAVLLFDLFALFTFFLLVAILLLPLVLSLVLWLNVA